MSLPMGWWRGSSHVRKMEAFSRKKREELGERERRALAWSALGERTAHYLLVGVGVGASLLFGAFVAFKVFG